jgi:hypothetical protein
MTVDPHFFTRNVDQQRYGKTICIPPLFQEWNIFLNLSGDFCLTEQLIGALCSWAQRIPWVPLCTYLLTPWSRILLEKLNSSQLIKKFPTVYETQRFITAFTSARHMLLSWDRSIQSVPPHLTSWRSILREYLCYLAYKCVCVRTCIHTHTHTHIYIYIYTLYIHVHTHINTFLISQKTSVSESHCTTVH